jgi:hypothetical protein
LLLKPVSKTVSALAAFVVIITSAMQAVTALFYLSPLLVLQGGQSVIGFSTEQAQALALVLIKVNGAARRSTASVGLCISGRPSPRLCSRPSRWSRVSLSFRCRCV